MPHIRRQFDLLIYILICFCYFRYGSYYVYILSNIEELYPGMKSIIEGIGLSAQGQENHHVLTAIDQRGEQTINKD